MRTIHLATPKLHSAYCFYGGKELFCLKVIFLSMNSLFFDKGGDKFSTDSSVFSTNVSRVLQGWKEEDNFAAEKNQGFKGLRRILETRAKCFEP